jgi:hypothetical protein
MAYDAARANVVLFGGYAGGTSLLGDTWMWDGSRWTEQHPAVSPSSRAGAQMAFDPVSRLTVLFGGGSGGTPHDDVWTWDGTTWAQKRADSPAVTPGAAPSPDATYPTYRGGIGIAFDAAVGKLVLITAGSDGGQPSTTPDTWAWDGQTWRPLGHFPRTTIIPYGNLHDGAVAEHPKTKRLVMFGGYSIAGGPAVDDTWTFDGSTWSKASAPSSPAPQSGAALAREQSGDLVLFGGVNRIASNETWKWNGSTWLQLHPTASPSARSSASMVYDSSRGLTILFGGASDATSNALGAPRPPQNDIWTWDGVTWRQVA